MGIGRASLLERAFCVIAMASVLGACSARAVAPPSGTPTSPQARPEGESSASTASLTAPMSIAPPFIFQSQRYGYEARFPTGWYTRGEVPGKWTSNEIGYFGAGTDAFEEDFIDRGRIRNVPGVTYGLYISAAQLSAPIELVTWADKLAATMKSDSSCQGKPVREKTTVDGEPAIILVYDRLDCRHDHHVLVVGVIHGSMA